MTVEGNTKELSLRVPACWSDFGCSLWLAEFQMSPGPEDRAALLIWNSETECAWEKKKVMERSSVFEKKFRLVFFCWSN
jgi:hypothetical protein